MELINLIIKNRMRNFKINLRIMLVMLILSKGSILLAQSTESDTDSVKIFSHAFIGRYQGDSIELRWAPSSYIIWQQTSETGWILERIEMSKSLYNLNDQTPITGDSMFKKVPNGDIKPWSMDELKMKAAKTDSNTGAALQLLYEPIEIPKASDPLASMKKLEEDQSRRYGFAMMTADFSNTTAKALGLRYVDKNVKLGKAYLYRLYALYDGEMVLVDTIQLVVDTRNAWEPAIVQKVFTEVGDKEISINWPSFNDGFFSAYDIERSTDKKNWKKLNRKPYMVSKSFSKDAAGFFVDTALESNYKIYYYRVRGYSAFGDKGLYSDIVSASGVDLIAPAPAFDIKVIDLGMNKVKVIWGSFATEKDLKGFYVGKSTAAAGVFPKVSKLLSPSSREFIDDKVNPLVSNYYVIISTDTSGNESVSYVAYADLQDTIAPAKPTGLAAEIDTLGYVYLSWKEGEELDIIGYRIYWSNDKNAEFSQITGEFVPGINYTDSIELNTLTEKVYYRIAAVDHRYNHSDMSDILELKRPDRVSPVSPVIIAYNTGSGQIDFQWINSTSSDVVKQVIQRRVGKGIWETRSEIANNTENRYFDKLLELNKDYTYQITAIDEAGNKSEPSFPLQILLTDKGNRNGISSLKVTKDDKTKMAQITWILPEGKIAKILIYKNISGEGLTYFRTISNNLTSFSERIKDGVTVSYAVKLIYTDGQESSMSEEVVLGK